MLMLMNFSESKKILYKKNNQNIEKIFNLQEDSDSIAQVSKIIIINFPGSYVGIRNSMAIAKAFKFIYPEMQLFSLNLLRDYAAVNFPHISSHFYVINSMIYFYNSALDEFHIYNKNILNLETYENEFSCNQIINNSKALLVNYSLSHIINSKFEISNFKQEYFDKFVI
jgi:tRNA A37 threonylcarbamoyladenosine modification protein TsaB